MTKQEKLDFAKKFFSENEGVDKVYFTSDGNMFRAEHYAHNWKVSLKDQAVTPVTRAEALGLPASTEDDTDTDGQGGGSTGGNTDEGGKPEGGADDAKAERDALVKRHIELFDTKPVGLSIEKLKAKIAAKEAEAK